ncbi:neuroblastoma breakpoint family member 10-like [Sagmatias obliquidens]|uniref:neuroblastoma breakpoint family member 10-like n=1 Tax=Sagmatias obliquidens TaxID=3371155 RepID=UPI000F445209|nr:neuroblastoma breakpoint family member 10-like [Lagenorhynchus obliquidens]
MDRVTESTVRSRESQMPDARRSRTADCIDLLHSTHMEMAMLTWSYVVSVLLVCTTQGECTTLRISCTHREYLFSPKGTPSVELQEVEKKEVPQESQDECVLTPSILQGSSDCNQPYSDGKFAFDESEVDPAPDGACGCSHAEEDEIPTDLPNNQNDHKQVDGQEPVSPSVNLQDVGKKEVLQESQDECVLAPSTPQEGSNCYQPYSDEKFAFDEEKVGSALDGACGCSHAKEDEISTGLPVSVSSKLAVLVKQSSEHQDTKTSTITLFVCFHEPRQSPGISLPHEWPKIQ